MPRRSSCCFFSGDFGVDWQFRIVLVTCCWLVVSTSRARVIPNTDSSVPLVTIHGVEGKSVTLPCDLTPPNDVDKVHMVLWYKGTGNLSPIYSFDARGKDMHRGSHHSHMFGPRASYKTVRAPAALVIDNVLRHDEGIYRCRADFVNSESRTFSYNLSVIVPPQYPVVLDKWGRQLNSTIGPQQEGEEVILTCRVVGGKPQPLVRWLINNVTVDELYEQNSGDVIENRLVWPSGNRTVKRKDLNAIFTCQAINTDLVDPREISLVLDLFLRPLTVKILSAHQVLDADQRYRLSCESAGSRPPAVITWYKNGKVFQFTDTKTEKHENVTRSEISITPGTQDDGKVIMCRAENPDVNSTSEKHVETTWNLRVVYPPVVSLHIGASLKQNEIKEGDDVYFECQVRANPPTRKLTWTRNGVQLVHNTTARIILSNQSLVLQKVSRQSAGTYKCSAVNSKGEATSNQLKLRVKYAPICKSDRVVIVGASRSESVDIQCAVDADPPARSFKWKFNNSGETLDVGSDRFSSGSRGSVLRYMPVTELDYGTLSCSASNTIGTQVTPCLYQVVLAGKPQPMQNCSVRNETSSSVDISCVPGYDGGLPQTFLLELYSTQEPMGLILNLTNGEAPTFTLSDLGLEGSAMMRVVIVGVNAKGRSSPVIWDDFMISGAHYAEDTQNISSVTSALNIVTTSIVISFCFVVLLVLLICKLSRGSPGEHHLVEKVSASHSMKSATPHHKSKDLDEVDPDIIPAKFEPPNISGSNGTAVILRESPLQMSNSDYGDVTSEWVTQNHQSNNVNHILPYHSQSPPPTYDLELKSSSSPEPIFKEIHSRTSTLKKQPKAYCSDLLDGGTKGDDLNGQTISEKLMSSRLPESCV
uniref:Protein turtle homolog A n=1 Tax=Cacopsylla melanoneura TaxID=428564 RepID=A0A8D8TAK1_9HEMI